MFRARTNYRNMYLQARYTLSCDGWYYRAYKFNKTICSCAKSILQGMASLLFYGHIHFRPQSGCSQNIHSLRLIFRSQHKKSPYTRYLTSPRCCLSVAATKPLPSSNTPSHLPSLTLRTVAIAYLCQLYYLYIQSTLSEKVCIFHDSGALGAAPRAPT